ncbi:MAG TPA: diaminopimelate dehydrogenase [Alcanivoracaceae bacterium]|nr:diaminopimelate dehydrogenase [Alcanivoracaceae bacterium]
MAQPIRVAILGYGNLGRGVEAAVQSNPDMQLVAIFSRRSPDSFAEPASVPFVQVSNLPEYNGLIDVLILCGGSATDLPEQTPEYVQQFVVVDSFDTHANVPEHFAKVDEAARANNSLGVIATGWDPGLFSLNRVLAEAVLPKGDSYTFWGKGLSQGHSDAVRRVPGVAAGVQYTLPNEESVEKVRNGERPVLSTREKHVRDCYVVLEEGANEDEVREAIVTMPNYFADFDTTVTFISLEELQRDHAAMPHGGVVLRSGETENNHKQVVEFGLRLGSNPEFTGSVLTAYARAAHRLYQAGERGAKTVFDIPIGLLSPYSAEQLRATQL